MIARQVVPLAPEGHDGEEERDDALAARSLAWARPRSSGTRAGCRRAGPRGVGSSSWAPTRHRGNGVLGVVDGVLSGAAPEQTTRVGGEAGAAKTGASGLRAASTPSTVAMSRARCLPCSTRSARARARRCAASERAGSSGGRKVSKGWSPAPSQPSSAPSCSTTSAPAARWGRASARGGGPLEEGSPGVRGIGRGEDERGDVLARLPARAQALVGPGQGELRAPASLDEVAPARRAPVLQRLEHVVDDGEAAGDRPRRGAASRVTTP